MKMASSSWNIRRHERTNGNQCCSGLKSGPLIDMIIHDGTLAQKILDNPILLQCMSKKKGQRWQLQWLGSSNHGPSFP